MSKWTLRTPSVHVEKNKLKIGDGEMKQKIGKPDRIMSAREFRKICPINSFTREEVEKRKKSKKMIETNCFGEKVTPYTYIDPGDDNDEKYLIRISNLPVDCSDFMSEWYDWSSDLNPEPVGVLIILDDVGQFIVFQVHLQNGFLNVLASNERLRLFDIKMRPTQAIDEFVHLNRYTAPRLCLTLFDEFLSPAACNRYPFPVNMITHLCEFEEPPSIFDDELPDVESEPSILAPDGNYHQIIEVFGLETAFKQ